MRVRWGWYSDDPETQDALEILALALDYCCDDRTPESSWGIHVLLGAQRHLIERDKEK